MQVAKPNAVPATNDQKLGGRGGGSGQPISGLLLTVGGELAHALEEDRRELDRLGGFGYRLTGLLHHDMQPPPEATEIAVGEASPVAQRYAADVHNARSVKLTMVGGANAPPDLRRARASATDGQLDG